MSNNANELDPEIRAISAVHAALRDLEPNSQSRVLRYVTEKFGIQAPSRERELEGEDAHVSPSAREIVSTRDNAADEQSEELGISPAGIMWATRNRLSGDDLFRIFSLGVDEIDLVSRSVPGESKKDRMRSVFLLKGIASYLSTGTAKFPHDQVREVCLHYDAWDSKNFSRMLSSISSEVSGTKDSGYGLTARGLTNAAEIIKTMLQKG